MIELITDMYKWKTKTVYKLAAKNGEALIGIFPNEEADFYQDQFESSEPSIKTKLVDEPDGYAQSE